MAGRRYGGQTMVEMSSTIFSDKRTWRCLSVVWRKSSQDYLYDISMQLCLEKKIHTERAAQIGVSFRECHSNPLLTLTEWISHRRLVCLWLWCKAFFFFFEINLFLLLRRHSSDITAMSDNDIITPSPEECLSSLALANTVLWKQQECDLAHTHLHCYISTHTHLHCYISTHTRYKEKKKRKADRQRVH